MSSIIDSTYFTCDINVPASTLSDLTSYITRYEPEILVQVLGYELADLVMNSTELSGRLYDLINGKDYTITRNGRDQKVRWNGLKNTVKISLIAYYVYYWYQRAKVVLPGVGGVGIKPKLQNADYPGQSVTVSQAWDRLEELAGYPGQDSLAPSLYNYLIEYQTTYPEWVFSEVGSVNAFDL